MKLNSKLVYFFSILITVSMIGFTACTKSEEVPISEENQEAFDIAKDTEIIQNQLYATYDLVLDGLDGELDGSRSGRTEGCATVTHNETARTVTVDFGTSCVGQDGRTRSGKIIVNYRDRRRMTRDELTITFENYVTNGYAIEGVLRTDGFSKDASDQWEYNLTIENATVRFADKSIKFTLVRTYTWIEGSGSLDNTDNVFRLRTTFIGITDGITFTSNSSTPLIKKSICWAQQITYPVSGVLELEFRSSSERTIPNVTLDYGNGACDKEATLKAGNQTTVITLP